MATTDFTALYDPNLRTNLTLGGPGIEYGSGGGEGFGLDIDQILGQVYNWKQKAAAADWKRQQDAANLNAQRQAAALRYNAQLQAQAEEEQRALAARQENPLWGNLQRLDEMNRWNPSFAHGAGLLGTNDKFMNLPAATAITTGKDPFDKRGWDMYKAFPSSTAGEQAGKNLRQKQLLDNGYAMKAERE